MTRKLPDDAFAFYVALGTERSYELVGKKYGASKRTVVRAAEREGWPDRLEAIERKAREVTDAKLADDMHEANLRHRKLLLAVSSRIATALQTFQLQSAMEAVKAAEMVIKYERLLLGEPGEKSTLTVEKVTRDELSRFLTDKSENEDDWADDGDEALEA